MSEFLTYFQLGFEHLLDRNAPDHLLFVLMICLPYQFYEWKKLFLLVSAFTLGHSITLGLLMFIDIPANYIAWVEFLIALSIAVSAVFNLLQKSKFQYFYFLIAFFGLIHGIGFGGQLKSLLQGTSWSFLTTLLPFNLGLEVAQLAEVTFVISILHFMSYPKILQDILSLLTLFISLWWVWERM